MTVHRADCPCDDCWYERRTLTLANRALPDTRHQRSSYAPAHNTERQRRYRQRKDTQ